MPCARYIAINVRAKDWFAGKVVPFPVVVVGRSSSAVCIALFTLSAGNDARLKAAPAHAPDRADSHGRRSIGLALPVVGIVESSSSEKEDPRRRTRRARRREAMYSLVPNHAAVPPVSRMKVPVCPSHSPRMPVVRITDMSTEMGPGRFRGLAAAAAEACGTSIWTCILHFTSSIGVLGG